MYGTNKVNAEAVLPFTLIPTEAGHITFPEFRLPWWNALTDSLEYAIIKPQFLRVAMNESSSARFLPPVEPTPPESNHTLASDSDELGSVINVRKYARFDLYQNFGSLR